MTTKGVIKNILRHWSQHGKTVGSDGPRKTSDQRRRNKC